MWLLMVQSSCKQILSCMRTSTTDRIPIQENKFEQKFCYRGLRVYERIDLFNWFEFEPLQAVFLSEK